LYADANGDNIPDGAAIANTSTNASGIYGFSGLTPGNYIVGVVPPAGYAGTTTTATSATPNNDNNADNNGVTVASGELRSNFITLTTAGEPTTDGDGNNGNLTLDFGLKATGSIGDFVWQDLNNNGIQDTGEPGIAGVTVTLTLPDATTVTTTTNASGGYLFPNLLPGTYSVAFATPAGYIPATSNAGANDAIDSDPIGGVVTGINLAAGQNNLTIDAGFRKLIRVSGNVWHDVNAMSDGLVNDTRLLTTPPSAQIPANLYAFLVNDATGLIVGVEAVDPLTGTFAFEDVTPNTDYYVVISRFYVDPGFPPPTSVLPSGWQHTGQNLGIDPGNDGLNDGLLYVPVETSDVINVNFGIKVAGRDIVIG
jgi:SdrD B-like domain